MPDQTLRDILTGSGLDATTIDASLRLDAVLQTWRRKVAKRELGQSAIVALGLSLEMSQLDVLFAIDMIAAPNDGSEPQEVTIGAIGERLSIDPSRASRLVSEVVLRGYAKRQASQQDSRRTIIALTEDGNTVTKSVRTYKFLLLGTYLRGWTEAETETLIDLLGRLGEWTDRTSIDRGCEFERQVAILAEQVAHLGPTRASA